MVTFLNLLVQVCLGFTQLANRFCEATIISAGSITVCSVLPPLLFEYQILGNEPLENAPFWALLLHDRVDFGANDGLINGLSAEYIENHSDLYLAYMLLYTSSKLRPFVWADNYLGVKIT